MSITSTMFILYHRDHNIPMDSVATALAEIPDVLVEQIGPSHITVREDGWPIHVYVSTEPHVQEESQEIARFRDVASRPDCDLIATSDCRIEVSYEPDPDTLYFNTWLLVTEKLYPLVHGIVYDTDDGTFPYDPES